MAQSVVDICNLALGNVGASHQISSLTERTKEAQECGRFFDHARRRSLRAFDWPFARVIEPITRVDVPAVGRFPLVYAYPASAVAFRRIERGSALRAIPYEITAAPAGGKYLRTAQAGAVGRWTIDAGNINDFDELFVSLLAWALAGDICMPLTKSQAKQKNCVDMFRMIQAGAQAEAANEEPHTFDPNDKEPDAEWIRARP